MVEKFTKRQKQEDGEARCALLLRRVAILACCYSGALLQRRIAHCCSGALRIPPAARYKRSALQEQHVVRAAHCKSRALQKRRAAKSTRCCSGALRNRCLAKAARCKRDTLQNRCVARRVAARSCTNFFPLLASPLRATLPFSALH